MLSALIKLMLYGPFNRGYLIANGSRSYYANILLTFQPVEEKTLI